MDISYELDLDHKKNEVCMAKELREIVKIVKLMKITCTAHAYQCHLFGTSIYLYFNSYCLATF